jgi:glycerate 2-kinase
VSAALTSADAAHLVARALRDPPDTLLSAHAIHLIAVGKAADVMAVSFASRMSEKIVAGLVVGARERVAVPKPLQFRRGAHPVPDADSVAAAHFALGMAAAPGADVLVVLLSGGASSMLALPAPGVTLEAKQEATRLLLSCDADIREINCVRKHLSAVKGGRLAAASAAPVLTLAVSDVVGDDLSIIGSGPTVPDPTTYADALAVLDRCGRDAFPAAVLAHLRRGMEGAVAETPKPGDVRLETSRTSLIGTAADALAGARDAAAKLGYAVVVREKAVVGEARHVASSYVTELARLTSADSRPLCVLSAGETTVRVVGAGRGGRNQEFALAAALKLPLIARPIAVASVGTDGIDGPTDAAGAIADSTTVTRASARGLDPMQYLDDNDAWTFFESLSDLVRTGVTNTNVGDIQVALIT